jgi:hypothetical protein
MASISDLDCNLFSFLVLAVCPVLVTFEALVPLSIRLPVAERVDITIDCSALDLLLELCFSYCFCLFSLLFFLSVFSFFPFLSQLNITAEEMSVCSIDSKMP